MSEQLLSTKAKFEVVWAELRRLGIKQVIVSFSGEGDSGQIDDVNPGFANDIAATSEGMQFYTAACDTFQAATVVLDGLPVKLRALIEELTDPLLTGDANWWDNDGGFGEARWILNEGDEPPMIEVEINVRIVETELHSYEFDRHGEAG